MIPTLKPSDQQFLNQLNRISDRMLSAQRQVTTGVRISQVSDDPDQISTLLQARANLSSAQQIQSNLGRVQAEVDSGEQALQSAVTLFERARTLGAQGASGTYDAGSRAAIAQEIGSVLQQMVGVASTQVEGRYIFSGDTDQAAPYTVDLSQSTPVSAYLGSDATRLAQHPNGTTFRVSHTAQQIFDSTDPATNVFGALTNLRDALLSNDDTAITTAVDGLKVVGDHLNSELAFYGTTQNTVAAAQDFGQRLQVQLKTQISGLEDADLSQAILELNQGKVQQQAALNSRSQLPQTTLFDFLR